MRYYNEIFGCNQDTESHRRQTEICHVCQIIRLKILFIKWMLAMMMKIVLTGYG